MTPNRSFRQTSRFAAFTLIELLVVVAVISVLVSLLFPALGVSRDMAKSIGCKSNFRQLGVCMASYESDFGFIPALYNASWANKYAFWLGKLYVDGLLTVSSSPATSWGADASNCKLLRCPAMPSDWLSNGCYYGMNYCLPAMLGVNYLDVATLYPYFLQSSKISRPSSRLLVGESCYFNGISYTASTARNSLYPHNNRSGVPPWTGAVPSWFYYEWPASARANILYLDGHVSDLSNTEINTGRVGSEAICSVLLGYVR